SSAQQTVAPDQTPLVTTSAIRPADETCSVQYQPPQGFNSSLPVSALPPYLRSGQPVDPTTPGPGQAASFIIPPIQQRVTTGDVSTAARPSFSVQPVLGPHALPGSKPDQASLRLENAPATQQQHTGAQQYVVPIQPRRNPIQQHPAPIQQNPTPVQQHPAHIQQHPAPLQQHPAPIQQPLTSIPLAGNLISSQSSAATNQQESQATSIPVKQSAAHNPQQTWQVHGQKLPALAAQPWATPQDQLMSSSPESKRRAARASSGRAESHPTAQRQSFSDGSRMPTTPSSQQPAVIPPRDLTAPPQMQSTPLYLVQPPLQPPPNSAPLQNLNTPSAVIHQQKQQQPSTTQQQQVTASPPTIPKQQVKHLQRDPTTPHAARQLNSTESPTLPGECVHQNIAVQPRVVPQAVLPSQTQPITIPQPDTVLQPVSALQAATSNQAVSRPQPEPPAKRTSTNKGESGVPIKSRGADNTNSPTSSVGVAVQTKPVNANAAASGALDSNTSRGSGMSNTEGAAPAKPQSPPMASQTTRGPNTRDTKGAASVKPQSPPMTSQTTIPPTQHSLKPDSVAASQENPKPPPQSGQPRKLTAAEIVAQKMGRPKSRSTAPPPSEQFLLGQQQAASLFQHQVSPRPPQQPRLSPPQGTVGSLAKVSMQQQQQQKPPSGRLLLNQQSPPAQERKPDVSRTQGQQQQQQQKQFDYRLQQGGQRDTPPVKLSNAEDKGSVAPKMDSRSPSAGTSNPGDGGAAHAPKTSKGWGDTSGYDGSGWGDDGEDLGW
ncbi:hypothetical protein B0T22DRAFT_206807, partial [Podospora appendiculata]